MKKVTVSALAVAAVVLGLGVAAPAHADDQSFLDSFHSSGAYNAYWKDAQLLTLGHGACTELRTTNKTPQQVASDIPQLSLSLDQQALVTTAQHELCPDTQKPLYPSE